MQRRCEAVAVGAAALVLTVLGFTSGSALANHPATGVYDIGLWSTALRGDVQIHINDTMLGAWDDRLVAAAGQWDAVGTTLDFHFIGEATYSRSCGASTNHNMHYRGLLDGPSHEQPPGAINKLAVTTYCVEGGVVDNYFMEFDTTEKWYTGTSSTPPTDQIDFYSVATHEFGHSGGWDGPEQSSGHFDEQADDVCPNTSTRQTMCELYLHPPVHPASIMTVWRTLGAHDISAFADAY